MLRLKSAGLACLILIAAQSLVAAAQQTPDELVKVFKPGHDTVSPQVLPTDFFQAITTACSEKLSGTAELSLIVAADGTAKNILFRHFIGTDLDLLAVRILSQQRFTPGMHNGIPVAVGQAVRMKLDGCVVTAQEANGQKQTVVRLLHAPEEKFSDYAGYPDEVLFTRPATPEESKQKLSVPAGVFRIGKGITPPMPVNTPAAEFPPLAKRMDAICLITLIVDATGLPEDFHVARPSNPAYDAQALDAVSHYRFKPAMRNGTEPVPVMMTVEVNFRAH